MAEKSGKELEGAGNEAPPAYEDIASWMAGNGLEMAEEDVDFKQFDEHSAPFIQTSAPLPIPEKKKPCINHCGTMLKSTFCFCCSKTGAYTNKSNQLERSAAEEHHTKMQQAAPHFMWNITCYHDEQRTRQVSNSDGGYSTEHYTVQVVTHTAQQMVPVTGFFDTSPEKRLPPSQSLFTRVKYKNAYNWRTVHEQAIFLNAYNAWVAANTCDARQRYTSTYHIPGFKSFLMELEEGGEVPCCYAGKSWWYCTGLMCCGYCYRIGLKRISGKRDCHISKTVWMQQSERQQFQEQKYVQHQPIATPNPYAPAGGGGGGAIGGQYPYAANPAFAAPNPYAPAPAAPNPYAPAPAPNPYAPGGGGGGGAIEKIAGLKGLLDAGAITQGEFEEKKSALLASM